MRFVIKGVLYLAAAGLLGLVAFAVFSDLPAPQREVALPIEAK